MTNSDPVYLRVVEDLRRQIIDGALPPGAAIPSRVQLTQRYGVGETAARHALRVLVTEGLIVGRVGSGHYVRERPILLPLHRGRLPEPQPGGPRSCGDWRVETVTAGPEIARRLRLGEYDEVVRTHCVTRIEGRPAQITVSHEARLGQAEPVPEDGRKNLLARMSAVGVKITEIVESVSTRVPRPVESDIFGLTAGVNVLHVERTHWAGDRPVETSDLVVPGDRYRLVYTVPL